MAQKNRLNPETAKLSLVTFLLGEELCALPITDVHQIIRDTPITWVPKLRSVLDASANPMVRAEATTTVGIAASIDSSSFAPRIVYSSEGLL